MRPFYKLLASLFLLFPFIADAQSPCVDGLAAGLYPCDNVDMYAFMGIPDLGGGNIEFNDIWGWTDPLDGKEYVLLGKTNGTAFVDISDPLNPVYLGSLPTHTVNSIWRDVKVYGNYAFIVSEASNHGMQVFDLTRLRNIVAPPIAFTEDAHYAGFGRAHNIVINEAVGLAYGVGTNTFSGGLHIVNISNPLTPTFAGDFAADGYTHDAQVVTYAGPDATHVGKEIAFCSNENTLTIVDVNDPTDCQQLSRIGYPNVAYAHQGWLTEDQQYFMLGDEIDETSSGFNTRTLIWNVQDLDNPVLIGEFFSSIAAIDHNLYTNGNLVYQSNYRGGLRILDDQNIASASLSEVAFFDVYPSSNSAAYNGSWSNYPYFSSGIVAVSHIEEGLFLLKPQFINASSTAPFFCSDATAVVDVTVEAGFVGPVNLSVVSGLPGGATASFSQNNVNPGTYQLSISNLPNVSQTLSLMIEGAGANYTYRYTVDVLILDCGVDLPGCTDVNASNYDPAATIDDGSCIYPCIDITLEILTDCWGEEVSWTLTDDLGNVVASVAANTLADQTLFQWSYCLEPGCYNWNISDAFGDGLSGIASGCAIDGNYRVFDANGVDIVIMPTPAYGSEVVEPFCVSLPVPGCTDVAACNYNPAADNDDGSCAFAITYYADADGDGFGDAANPMSLCAPIAGYVIDNTDCDDTRDDVYPGASGTQEGIDNNCDGNVDGPELTSCPGDFNSDGVRNVADFLQLLGEFSCNSGCTTDLNNDGIINATDVLSFLSFFGTPCP
jgi:choice-of-anchor B domain-containing protein